MGKDRRTTMAHPINRMALDLSHHNIVHDFDAIVQAGIVGIIHKASEGNSFVDEKYAGRRKGCAEKGMAWGAYHFGAHDDGDAQVDHCLDTADPDHETLICLDWEPYGERQMTKAQARKWIEEVEARLGRPGEVVIYSGNLAKEQLTA